MASLSDYDTKAPFTCCVSYVNLPITMSLSRAVRVFYGYLKFISVAQRNTGILSHNSDDK